MTILKWISITVFLLFMVLIAIVAIVKLFTTIGTIINIFKKYPEIEKYWFKASYYDATSWGTYRNFRLYTTNNGAVIKVRKEDGEVLYHLRNTIGVLLFCLVISFLFFGFCNTTLLLFA